MIRSVQSQSSGHAKAYFSEALVKSDYYVTDLAQEVSGRLQGKLAERLNLTGPVTKKAFFALCENRLPNSSKPLTPRTKDERTVGYDVNFHCPKSVSILHALSKDDHILEAFKTCVHQTMRDIEEDVLTRVRKGGLDDERKAGELIYADFIHQTARPVDNHVPDPHLHAHCFIFNATWDDVEQRTKAAQFREIQRSMPFYEARFHKRLADRLTELGYDIRPTSKSFEVKGVPQRVIDMFAKRTDQIGRVAKEKGITDAKTLSELGARTRAKKQKGHTMAELKADWKRQIIALGPEKEGQGEQSVRYAPAKNKTFATPGLCVDFVIRHGFERASVLSDRRLRALAYRHGIGHAEVTVDGIDQHFAADNRMIHVVERGQIMTTTKDVLAEEQHMVALAQQGQGKLRPLYVKEPDLALTGQQARAVAHVLTTTNRVSIIRGVAGSGKTTLMKEAVHHIGQAGKQVIVVAPTAQASYDVLRTEGFAQATTVARLLVDAEMQKSLQGQVLWLDEAGLLGTKDMTALLTLAQQQNARLILGGDTRQHASVVRGDALRILSTVGGLQTAEVSKIYRQRDTHYRQAVADLAKGDVAVAFDKLDGIGSIKSIDPLAPDYLLVQDYVETIKRGKSALVISPTHEQGEAVTKAIRQHLQNVDLLSKKEVTVSRLVSLNLTEAQKSDIRQFRKGQIVQFSQNRPGITRGSQWVIERVTSKEVIACNAQGQEKRLPLEDGRVFDVYERDEMNLAKGDTVRITHNGFDREKNRLNNGQMLEVIRFAKGGDVILQNQISKAVYRLPKDHGHLTHAYCVTSHSSQGRTVDEVFIHQPASTFAATSAKQFYVSVSRGRNKAHIYTDDKAQLLTHAVKLGDRQSAIELVGRQKLIREHVHDRIREEMYKEPSGRLKQTDKQGPVRQKDIDYEPRL